MKSQTIERAIDALLRDLQVMPFDEDGAGTNGRIAKLAARGEKLGELGTMIAARPRVRRALKLVSSFQVRREVADADVSLQRRPCTRRGCSATARLSVGQVEDPPPRQGQWCAHKKRNLVEYEGVADIDEELVAATIRVTNEIDRRLKELRAEN